LAEDADISLKIKKAGWKIVFSPLAIAMTRVPEKLKGLIRQRMRWDRGTLRTYFHKHGDLLFFWRYDWRNSFELALDYFFTVFLTFTYAIYIIIMLLYYPMLLVFVWVVCYFVYALSAFLTSLVAVILSERKDEEWPLLYVSIFFPFYKAGFRWVRFTAMLLETFRINYQDEYIPQSAWRNTKKW